MNTGLERLSKKRYPLGCTGYYTDGLSNCCINLGTFSLGTFSASELTLRIDPNWEPRPDVAGALKVDDRFPTRPIDIPIEILSDDQMTRLFAKCRHYVRIGIPQIFVFDPQARTIWEWSRETDNLERIHSLVLGNGSKVQASAIWLEFKSRIPKALA